MKRLTNAMLLATAVMCACADAGTSPTAGLVGTFVLVSYNGAALPAYIEPRLGACSTMIAGGSLTTTDDAHVVFSRSYLAPCVSQAPAAESRTGTLSVAGTTITVALDANTLNGPQVLTGNLADGQLTLHYTVENRTAPLEQTFVLARP